MESNKYIESHKLIKGYTHLRATTVPPSILKKDVQRGFQSNLFDIQWLFTVLWASYAKWVAQESSYKKRNLNRLYIILFLGLFHPENWTSTKWIYEVHVKVWLEGEAVPNSQLMAFGKDYGSEIDCYLTGDSSPQSESGEENYIENVPEIEEDDVFSKPGSSSFCERFMWSAWWDTLISRLKEKKELSKSLRFNDSKKIEQLLWFVTLSWS